jgi:hypothetical protein
VKIRDGFGCTEKPAALMKKAQDEINNRPDEPACVPFLFLEFSQLFIRKGLRIFPLFHIHGAYLLSGAISDSMNID